MAMRTGCLVQERDSQPPHRDRALGGATPVSAVLSATRPAAQLRLSGYSVTGAGTRLPVMTMPGKLPQRKLVTTAAAGYSSYGNQIGLATGQVDDLPPRLCGKAHGDRGCCGRLPCFPRPPRAPAPGDDRCWAAVTGRDAASAVLLVPPRRTSWIALSTAAVRRARAHRAQAAAPVPPRGRLQDDCRRNDFGAGGVSLPSVSWADGLYIDLK